MEAAAGKKRSRLPNCERWRSLAASAGFSSARLAAILHVSDRHLRRSCRSHFGKSTQVWLNQLRMEAAGDLLVKEKSVKWVAALLRYKQASHFSRQFKAYYGVSPSDCFLRSQGGMSVTDTKLSGTDMAQSLKPPAF